METLAARLQSALPDLVEWRRHFHRYPELAYHEVETARVIADELRKYHLPVREQIGKTGLTALWESGQPGPTVLLRFDIDALPIVEQNQVDYCSTVPGVMHACGHDCHIAVGLLCARLLTGELKPAHGRIKFVFQPAEEGAGGAQAMVDDGVLLDPHPDYSLAYHIWNEKPLGTIILHPGPFMAASDLVEINIQGKGGHGAVPHLAVDPIVAGSAVVNQLQTIVARNLAPREQGVVSITQFQGGDAWNIIPDRVFLRGSIRSFTPEARELLHRRVTEVASQTASALGCKAEVLISPITPAVVNDVELTHRLQSIAARELPDLVVDQDYQTMGSDDMALFMQDIPGCYVMVGSANADKGLIYGHHHPRFDVDEQAMIHAATLLIAAARELLA